MPTETVVPNPKRFEAARSTLLIDRFMNHFIKVGGIGIILAVFGIFLFIFWQILPLFQKAEVKPLGEFSLPQKDYVLMGIDEWAELPFLVESDGSVSFFDLAGKKGLVPAGKIFQEPKKISAVSYVPRQQRLVFGTEDGFFATADIGYQAAFEREKRRITHDIKAGGFLEIGRAGVPLRQIQYGDAGERKLAAALQLVEGKREVHAVTLVQEETLLEESATTVGDRFDLTSMIEGTPRKILVNGNADMVLVSTEEGDVVYFSWKEGGLKPTQVFKPFADLADPSVASLDFLLGDVSVVATSNSGVHRVFSLFVPEGKDERLFGKTKEMAGLPGGAGFYQASLRNKGYLIGRDKTAALCYATTEAVRWQEEFPFAVKQGVLSGKYHRILLLDGNNKLHLYELNDPHPETSFKALFGKLWYEGASEPKYEWQSTGGSDDFEPKLSIVPLFIGTLKGTLYALIFAVPIALLAAIYTSQFLQPDARILIKPTMEIMASLPSVVLGFLAALWLAPVLEKRVPSVLLMVILVPAAALGWGWFWSRLPIQIRKWIRPGHEFVGIVPVMIAAGALAWMLGPVLEKLLFGGDFRLWWPEATGARFEQRNSLVVGFMMGFAVIPIIFTIAEDALSNVPAALKSASLACGASRWQTALRVVLPTASAGIFSAAMIGFGRAVGETMIVVMATGNTPIMDFNIFSGMRTLSANIAVELPEAPHHGTLYRALFLGAMVLFLLTFFVNTLAEILRQHLREKFKTV